MRRSLKSIICGYAVTQQRDARLFLRRDPSDHVVIQHLVILIHSAPASKIFPVAHAVPVRKVAAHRKPMPTIFSWRHKCKIDCQVCR